MLETQHMINAGGIRPFKLDPHCGGHGGKNEISQHDHMYLHSDSLQ